MHILDNEVDVKIAIVTDSLYRAEDNGVEIVIKRATSSKPDPDGGLAIRYPVYHVYNDDGLYIGQAMNLGTDIQRVMREYRTRLKQ